MNNTNQPKGNNQYQASKSSTKRDTSQQQEAGRQSNRSERDRKGSGSSSSGNR